MLQHLNSRLRSTLFRIPIIIQKMSTSGQSSTSSVKSSSAATIEAHLPEPSVSSGTLSLTSPIGYIKSCFKSKNGTPRQPSVCSYARAKLKILKSVFVCPDHSLDGLAQFSHVWIMFVFHENRQENFTKAKVKPPRLDGKKVGVFASRSPHRPNPIGLTLARLDKVEGDTLYLSGMDMLDGTPVLDIKPYVSDYDNPKQTSTRATDHDHKRLDDASRVPSEVQETRDGALPSQGDSQSMDTDRTEHFSKDSTTRSHGIGESSGHAKDMTSDLNTDDRDNGNRSTSCESSDATHTLQPEDVSGDDVRVADWVGAPPIKELTVRFTPSAKAQLAAFWGNTDPDHKLEFLYSYDEAHQAIEDILSADPRSVYRRKSCSDRLYYFTIDNLHITSWFGAGFVEVLQVQPVSLADIPKHTAASEGLASFKVKR